MKESKQGGHKGGSASDKANPVHQNHKSPETDNPIAEKDEVKQAEDDLRKRKTKPLQRKLRIL